MSCSELERLRQAPKRQSGAELVRALKRVDDIARFELGRVEVSKVPVRRMKTLAKLWGINVSEDLNTLSSTITLDRGNHAATLHRHSRVSIIYRGMAAAGLSALPSRWPGALVRSGAGMAPARSARGALPCRICWHVLRRRGRTGNARRGTGSARRMRLHASGPARPWATPIQRVAGRAVTLTEVISAK